MSFWDRLFGRRPEPDQSEETVRGYRQQNAAGGESGGQELTED